MSVVRPGPLSCRWKRHDSHEANIDGEDCTGIDEPASKSNAESVESDPAKLELSE